MGSDNPKPAVAEAGGADFEATADRLGAEPAASDLSKADERGGDLLWPVAVRRGDAVAEAGGADVQATAERLWEPRLPLGI